MIDRELELAAAIRLFKELEDDSIYIGIHIDRTLRPQTLLANISRGHNRQQELAERGQEIIKNFLQVESPHTIFHGVEIVSPEQRLKSPFETNILGIRKWEDLHGMPRRHISEIRRNGPLVPT